jgi:hypothetical protein
MQVVLVNAALLVERDPRIIHQHVVDVIQQKWLVLKALNMLERWDLGALRFLAFLFLSCLLNERRGIFLLALRRLPTGKKGTQNHDLGVPRRVSPSLSVGGTLV